MFSLIHKKTSSINNQNVQIKTPMLFELKQQSVFKPTLYPSVPRIEQPPPQIVVSEKQPTMKWGRPIWTFFHVTAQKIRPEYFNNIIKDYLNNIILICGVLPCPVCSAHATEYLRSINLNNIRSKEDLIHFFFNFHNAVNMRKGFQVLIRDNIPDYGAMNTLNVIHTFMRAFEDKSRAMKLMADDLARIRTAQRLKTWINQNIQYFEP
jgi:hypothetical protein